MFLDRNLRIGYKHATDAVRKGVDRAFCPTP